MSIRLDRPYVIVHLRVGRFAYPHDGASIVRALPRQLSLCEIPNGFHHFGGMLAGRRAIALTSAQPLMVSI